MVTRSQETDIGSPVFASIEDAIVISAGADANEGENKIETRADEPVKLATPRAFAPGDTGTT